MVKSAKQSKTSKKIKVTETVNTPESVVTVTENSVPYIYPTLDIKECSTTSIHGPVTPDRAKRIMGWETEKDYQLRQVAENPGSKPDEWLYGDIYHCCNSDGDKVRCHSNGNNRPFDETWCKELMSMVLDGQWAGPLTMPGETVNGETIRIGRCGRVLSGQHQLTALILADEMLTKSQKESRNITHPKYPFWVGKGHCVIEAIVITGLSEDEQILRTIDYVKPRSVADMLFTMNVYRDNTPHERKVLTRMLSAGIDLLWGRTEAKGYRTHPEIVGFLERHPKLMSCVEHIFGEDSPKTTFVCRTCRQRFASQAAANQKKCKKGQTHDIAEVGGRRISTLPFNAGHAAALMYLMGCSSDKTTDYSDDYRNEEPAPSEKKLDWKLWHKATEFWSRLAGTVTGGFFPVREALGRLIDSTPHDEENIGLGGRHEEKLAILDNAWKVFKNYKDDPDTPPFTDDDLCDGGALHLHYTDKGPPKILNGETIGGDKLPDGKVRLIEMADFQGIDCPQAAKAVKTNTDEPTSTPIDPTPDQMEQLKLEARERREEKEQQESQSRRERQKERLAANRAGHDDDED